MTLSQLPVDEVGESNPFDPTVPDSIRNLSPDLFAYLQQLTSDVRDQQTLSQAGVPTNHWSKMLTIDETPRYTLGVEASFYHETYGVFRGGYVKFDKMNSVSQVVTLCDATWTVSNDQTKTVTKEILGLICAAVIPLNGTYGWVLTQGINLHQLIIAGAKATRGQAVTWESDGSLKLDGNTKMRLGRIVNESDQTAANGSLVLGAGSILINTVSGNAEALFDPNNNQDLLDLDKKLDNLTYRVEATFGLNTLSIAKITQRIERLTADEATIELIQTLQATANFRQLANTAADNALRAMGITSIQLEAVNQLTQLASVYRNETGYYAESTTIQANTATLKANEGAISAEAAAVHEQSAKVSADASGISAQASESSRLSADVSAQNSQASALNAHTSEANASQHESSAKDSATLSASFAQQASDSADRANVDISQAKADIQTNKQAIADANQAIAKTSEDLTTQYTAADASLRQAVTTETDAKISTVNTAISNVNEALATTSQTLTTQFNQSISNIHGTITTETDGKIAIVNKAISDANGSIVSTAQTLTAQYQQADSALYGQVTNETNAKISQTAQAAADANAATTQLVTTQRSDFNGLYAQVQQNSGTIADHSGKLLAWFSIAAQAGTSRVSLDITAGGDNPGFDLIGDVRITGKVTINGQVILNGTVNTPQMASNSINNAVTASFGGGTAGADGSVYTDPQISITTVGGAIRLDVQTVVSRSGATALYRIDLYRNGQAIGRSFLVTPDTNALSPPTGFWVRDTPPAGTNTYQVKYSYQSGGNSTSSMSIPYVDLAIQEFKDARSGS